MVEVETKTTSKPLRGLTEEGYIRFSIKAYDTDGVICGDTVAVVDGGFIISVIGDDVDQIEWYDEKCLKIKRTDI